MPRGNNMQNSTAVPLIHAMILGDEKVGKTTWLLEAAEAGFNILMLDGDVASQRIADLSPAAQERIFYMDVSDDLVGEHDPRMIHTVATLMTSSKFLWNDTKQREYSRAKDSHDEETGACLDEIWEIRPAKFDHNWIIGIDSWTTLSYSAMLDKAMDLGVDIAMIEKAEQNMYQGVGNRLTNIAIVQQKAPCHTVIIGHGDQYEKQANPDKTTAGAVKMKDKIIEWTKMIPKSSSRPHGYTLGKFFSDIGWLESDKWGKRKIDFTKTSERTSGGNLNSKGDPKSDHRFIDLVKKIGGAAPSGDMGEGLIIHPPGTFLPAAAKPALALGAKPKAATPALESPKPAMVKGLGGLTGLQTPRK